MTNKENCPVQTENEQNAVLEKLATFINEQATPQELSKSLQRLITVIALTLVRNDETINPINKEWLDDGLFYVSQLSEIFNNECV